MEAVPFQPVPRLPSRSMLSTFNIILIGAFLCVVMLLVLSSLLHSGIAGVREWCAANALGIAAFILYALGKELPPLVAYEVANGLYAAAAAAMLAGFRRFFAMPVPWKALGAGIAAVVAAIAVFHYGFDSFTLRTITVGLFQAAVCIAIGFTVLRSREIRSSRYPYLFTIAMVVLVAAGHTLRGIIHFTHADTLTSLLQPSDWNVFFLSAGTLVLPVLTLGGVMMVHERLMAQAEHAANRDFLTGAWSRRAFFGHAERELLRARRTGREMSVLLLDVDHFKSINDNYGHTGGDRVLMDLALRAETVIRRIDYFARIGGEEFGVLLIETDQTSALAVGERLRSALERTKYAGASTLGIGQIAAYSVSVGVATLRDEETFAELMRRADAALYRAKDSGRNTVVCASSIP